MNAEIVAVGTELLLGQIVNTNAAHISDAVASIGVNVHHHSTVGDNLGRMTATLRLALERSDAVIVTGGLGPTPDDITREAVAAVVGRELVRDHALADAVQRVFERMGREMPESNLRQADLPEGATPIPLEGTAPGFVLEHRGKILFALPGVPWEMEAMLSKRVLPELRRRAGEGVIVSREILVMGLGESLTHERIKDVYERATGATIAYLAGAGLVRLRITAKAETESEALLLVRPLEEELRAKLGRNAVEGTARTMAQALGELLRRKGLTVAVAESLTGGLLATELTRERGASEYFLGGVVAYATDAKRDVLGVDQTVLAERGAVGEEAAAALAGSAAKRFSADLGLSATGVAGPEEQEGKPVGTVYVGADLQGKAEVRLIKGYGDRTNIRMIAVNSALDLGRRLLGEADG